MKKLLLVLIAYILLVNMPAFAQQEIEMLIINRDYQGALNLIEKEIGTNPSTKSGSSTINPFSIKRTTFP